MRLANRLLTSAVMILLLAGSALPRAGAATQQSSVTYLPLVARPIPGRIAFVNNSIGCPCSMALMAQDGMLIRTFPAMRALGSPAWSPDGTQIVFSGWEAEDKPQAIYRMAEDGTGLTKLAEIAAFASSVDWSPDGQFIVFDDQAEIYRMRPDGSDLVQLTDSPGSDQHPSWSPDGTQIAFASDRHGSSGIYVMDADGGNQRLLGVPDASESGPDWSPDGTQIAFARQEGRIANIYVMASDGTGAQALTSFDADDSLILFVGAPEWSPDSSHILFVRSTLRYPSIALMRRDGSEQRVISGGSSPAWGP
jgi:tol-pal system beta propeller repeat protein TolB